MTFGLCTFAAFVTLLSLDVAWIALNAQRYSSIARSMSPVAVFRWPAVVACYLTLAVLVAVFVVPDALSAAQNRRSVWTVGARGAVLGACTYGVYAFTNAAVVSSYTLTTALIETCWGATLIGSSAIVAAFAAISLRKLESR